MSPNRWPLLCLVCLIAFATSHAAEPEPRDGVSSPFSLRGFGTLGLARSDTDRTEYVRDLSQPYGLDRDWSARIDSLIGLQAEYRFDDRWHAVVQAMSRYRYDGSYDPEVSWAFVQYEPSPTFNLRLGRLGTEFYMLADSRLVGFANLTVRPPPDYFGPLVFSYLDGVDAGASLPIGHGILQAKLFAGRSPEWSPFYGDIRWNLDGTLLAGGHLEYVHHPWQVRIGHTEVDFARELPLNQLAGFDVIGLAPELSVKDRRVRYDSLGVVYDSGPLQIQLMLSQTEHDSVAYEDTRAGYAIVAYRLGQITPYLGYSRVSSEPDRLAHPPPPPLDALVSGLTRATHSDQHTWSLGARWDVYDNIALKAQIDWVRGSPTSVFPFRGDDIVWDGTMTVYSLALDFVF